MTAIITVKNLTRVFDVSKPWLNRVIERLPKSFLTAVSNVEFDVEQKTVYALVGESSGNPQLEDGGWFTDASMVGWSCLASI